MPTDLTVVEAADLTTAVDLAMAEKAPSTPIGGAEQSRSCLIELASAIVLLWRLTSDAKIITC
jgi:hypothetical protein